MNGTKRRVFLNRVCRCAAIVAWLLPGASAGYADELPRPGESIDAGDSYQLKDGSRAALHRVLHEVAIKHLRSKSAEPTLRGAGVNQDPLVPLAAIESGRSNVVDVYQVEDSQAIDRLLTVQGDEIAVFPVLTEPGSRRRIIATDDIIVQFAGGIGAPQAVALFDQEGLEIVASPVPSAPDQYLVRVASGPDKHALAGAGQVAGRQGVEWATPNFLRELEFYFTPNDEHFGKQQYLRNIGQNGAVAGADVKAETAWDITTGKPEVVIAIIDTGVDINHAELNVAQGKIFINPSEFGNGRDTNGIDDDGNGYIDDWRGWDFYSQDNNPQPGPSQEAGHGTSCAGIAAARGNDGQGIAGVAYGCKILPVKIWSDNGSTFASDFNVGQAIRYAADYADVLSCSWGKQPIGPYQVPAWETAIDYAVTNGGKGCAVFFASGNFTGWQPQTRWYSLSLASGDKLGFYFETGLNSLESVTIDQVRLLGQNGYDRVWWQDFEAGASDWTVAHGGGAASDWTPANVSPFLMVGTASTQAYRTPELYQAGAGAWAELRTPSLSLSGNFTLAFATRPLFGAATFKVRRLDSNDNFVSESALIPGLVGGYAVAYPANYVNSIAVGASTDFDRRSDYTQWGSTLF